MPKISPLAPASTQIKARTNANPGQHVVQNQNAVTPEEMVVAKVAPQGQTNTPEAQPEAKPLPPEHEGLAKKESALRALERDLKAKEAGLDARIKAAVDEALGSFRGKLKKQPLDVLNDEGLTYDDLVAQAVNAPDPQTLAITKKLEALENNQSKFIEESKRQADQQREAAVKQIRHDAQSLVDTNPEFETIKATGSVDEIVDKITKTFDETGLVMTVEQAAQEIETELFEEALKIAQLSKVKAKLTPTLTPELVQSAKQQPAAKQSVTLTNSMNSTKPMSARDRAIARFKGEPI